MFGLGASQTKTTTAGAVTKVATTQFAATYEIYQNMEINAWYKTAKTTAPATPSSKQNIVFAEVEALF